jgi:hypothetical protein
MLRASGARKVDYEKTLLRLCWFALLGVPRDTEKFIWSYRLYRAIRS